MKKGADRSGSLVEVLQALAADMAKAESDAEAEAGLKRLRQIRTEFLGRETGAVNAARRNAEALIAWLEARLEQLRQQLARKRRAQEGEVMEQIAKQREAEGPSLLPTELVEAVVHATTAKDPEEPTSSAPEKEPAKPARDGEEKQPPQKKQKKEKKEETKQQEAPEAPKPEPPQQEVPQQEPSQQEAPQQEAPQQEAPRQEAPQPEAPRQEAPRQEDPRPEAPRAARPKKPEWSKAELLAAHLAASVREDPKFFEKLRRAAKRQGPKQPGPADDQKAEAHYRALHDLGKRLVNLELHAKAIAQAKERREPVSPLLKTAAKELKGFMRDFKANKEARPELAAEYDRRFGGYAEQFAAMKPEKGGELLDQCRAERQSRQAAREPAPERQAEPEAPQLVLRRPDPWDQ